MRILYVARLFSGLESALLDGRWRPAGAPTIYKVIEELDRSRHELQLVLTAKDNSPRWWRDSDTDLDVDGLSSPVTVLAGERRFASPLQRGLVRDVAQAAAVVRIARQCSPDVVYVDRANLWAAAMLARVGRAPVVLRVMGVYPQMRETLRSPAPRDRLLRVAYRSPYAAVIMTEDGSGGKRWMEEALRPDVPRHLWLNGVDSKAGMGTGHPVLAGVPPTSTVVMFLGRLQPYKGGRPFLLGFLQASRRDPGLHAVVVGEGPEEQQLRDLVRAAGASHRVTFVGSVDHAAVPALHARCDIYVSLNQLGNLSNANLEAMRAGACMVTPRADTARGVDLSMEEWVPDDAVWRVSHAEDVEGVSEAILTLASDPGRRQKMGATIQRIAEQHVPTWSERVEREIQLLEQVGMDSK